jgi:hypothetical protein
VPDPNRPSVHQHTNHIEAIGLGWQAVAIDPDLGRPGQLPLLSPVDSLDRAAEVVALAGLDLHEHHGPSLLDHQVDIPLSVGEPVIDHSPPLPDQPPRRDTLPEYPECLPGL